MSTRAQRRGRSAPKQNNASLLPVYIGIAVVLVVGVVLLVIGATGGTTTSTGTNASATISDASLASYPSMGSADAPVTVVEFGDYQCPGCAAYATGQGQKIKESYVDTGKVKFIFHELPISSHAHAYVTAEAARIAGDQGKFWEMHELLFARQAEWAALSPAQVKVKFSEYAQELGLDVASFNQALESEKYRDVIEKASEESLAAGVQSTPSFMIDGKIYQASGLDKAIEDALASK